MAIYKDGGGNIYDDMGGAAKHLLPDGCVEITETEAADIRASAAPAQQTRFSSLEFLERFTETEQLAVVSATLGSAQVKLWYDKLLAAEYVDLNDPRTEGGIDALIAAGLITADRKAALMTPEVAA